MSKKIFAGVLTAVLFAGLLNGCGANESGSSSPEQEAYKNDKPAGNRGYDPLGFGIYSKDNNP